MNYRKTNQGYKQKLFQEYLEIIKDLIEDEAILEMDNYRQHGQVSTLVHSIYVSYSAFKIAKKLKT